MTETILIVVAHADDEVLGAGGTIARLAAQGDQVNLVFLTDGVGARGVNNAASVRRVAAANQAAKILGALPPHTLSFPDNRLDGVDLLTIVQELERIVAHVQPDVIYTHHAGDLNIDHAVCHRAIMTACRPLPDSKLRAIYAMEIASSTEWIGNSLPSTFVPNRFVDISGTWENKRAALQAYAEEMREFPHPRSDLALEALARWRGASAGVMLAEAFSTVREVER